MTKFEKETRQQLPGIHFHKKTTTTIKLAKCGVSTKRRPKTEDRKTKILIFCPNKARTVKKPSQSVPQRIHILGCLQNEGRRPKTEDRRPKTEDRKK